MTLDLLDMYILRMTYQLVIISHSDGVEDLRHQGRVRWFGKISYVIRIWIQCMHIACGKDVLP